MPTRLSQDLLVWPSLQEEIAPFLKYCKGVVLNAGSGSREMQFGERNLNVDIFPAKRPHVIGDLHRIPLRDESVDTVVSIAVLEHVRYPWIVAQEFYRVLRPAGHGVVCVPFLQPRHASPNDFVRFTQDGLSELMKYAGFEVIETAHVHHFGQTLAWLLYEYLQHNRPRWYAEAAWAGLLKRLSRGTWLGLDSPNTHNTNYVVVRKPGEATAARSYYLEALGSDDPLNWFRPLLACPHTRQPLRWSGGTLVSLDGRFTYGLTDGIPDLAANLDVPQPLVGVAGRSTTEHRGGDLAEASEPRTVAAPPASPDQGRWPPVMASEKSYGVTFKAACLQRLRRARPGKVAVLVTSEYEGIFRNGGVGTYYQRLSERLTAEGWHVLLLLTFTEKSFGGESELVAVKHVFSTCDAEQVLNLQPVHLATLSARNQDIYDHQSVCCFFFVQAVLNCFPGSVAYVEFPEMMGSGYRTIQAGQVGLLGHTSVTAVTMHSGHEWVFEANDKYVTADPLQLWRVAEYERFSFENADLSFYPSHSLRAKVDSYGWETSRAAHLPNLIPQAALGGSPGDDLPTLDGTKVPVVFFGRLEERKGLCTFLEALRELPPAMRQSLHVLFVGKIVQLYSAPLAHLDSREYIEQTLPPDVSYSILSDLYSAEALGYVRALPRAVVCLASPQENFPNTGLEMGQLPIKLVVSDTGGFRETLALVQRSVGVYWFEPKNPDALAEALRRAIADEAVALPVMQPADIERTNHALLARKETLIQQALARAAIVHVERPRVSLGVLWQGQASALMDCLASIDTQTYDNLDVIVLDNGGDAEEAREVIEHARALFPLYRFVRPPDRLTAGAAWNHAVELADGGYFLGVEAETVLAPFAVAQLVKAAWHAQAAILSCPGRARRTGEEIPGFSGGPLSRLMDMALPGTPWFLGAVALLQRFRRLEERDTLTHGWEVLAAALATGERIAYYPYPLWEARVEGQSAGLHEAARLKQQYQLRQYLAQIPPDQWCKRQLSMLLMAVQHLQAQVATSRPVLAEPAASPLPELQAQLSQAHADAAQLHAQLHDCHGQRQAAHATLEQTRADLGLARGRITAMESSKFWMLRRTWFRVKRTLGLPCNE